MTLPGEIDPDSATPVVSRGSMSLLIRNIVSPSIIAGTRH